MCKREHKKRIEEQDAREGKVPLSQLPVHQGSFSEVFGAASVFGPTCPFAFLFWDTCSEQGCVLTEDVVSSYERHELLALGTGGLCTLDPDSASDAFPGPIGHVRRKDGSLGRPVYLRRLATEGRPSTED